MTKEELIKLSRENLRKSKQGSLCECYDEAFIKGYKLSKKHIEKLKNENALVKSLLYCTQRTCDNCGFVNCENFQRQRKSKPCSLYIPYQVRIKNLAHESDVLRESFNNSEMNLASVSEQLVKAKRIIMRFVWASVYFNGKETDLIEEAEQFLKED